MRRFRKCLCIHDMCSGDFIYMLDWPALKARVTKLVANGIYTYISIQDHGNNDVGKQKSMYVKKEPVAQWLSLLWFLSVSRFSLFYIDKTVGFPVWIVLH